MRWHPLVWLWVVACSPAAPPSPRPSPPAVTAVASVAASAPPTPDAGVAPPSARRESPFHVALVSHEEGEPIQMKLLGSSLFLWDASAVPIRADGDELVWEPTVLAGLPRDFLNPGGSGNPTNIVDIAGEWPERAFMVTLLGHPRGGGWDLFAWQRDHWTAQTKTLPAPISLYGWMRELGPERFLLSYDENRAVDEPMRVVWLGGASAPKLVMPCFEAPADSASAKSGEFFVVAAKAVRCRGAPGDPGVNDAVLFVWEAGAANPKIIGLPGGFQADAIHARARDDVWMAGSVSAGNTDRPTVAHYDGRGVELSALPGEGHPHSITSEPDGTLWVAGGLSDTEPGVWRRQPGGAWSEVPLPEPAHAWVVLARGAGDVWISASSDRGKLVFHSQEPRVVLQAPSRELRWDAMYRLGRKDLPLPICSAIHVVIPRGDDPPARLASLKRAVGTLPNSKTITISKTTSEPALWVATVPDTATGERLKKNVRKLSVALAPQVVCREGLELREP